MRSILLLPAALFALAACSADGGEANAVAAEANASGAAVTNSAPAAGETPLARDAALAMIKQRDEGYEKIGKAMRAAKQGIDKQDLNAVRASAEQLASLAPQASGWFPAGTGPDVGKTRAKPEIWQERADFDRRMADFNTAAKAFQAAAAGGDFAAIGDAHAALGKTCSACHDRFRAKED